MQMTYESHQNIQNHAEGDVDKYIRKKFFPTQNTGVFIDVGAANPNYLSISALYRSLGWTVIAVEPGFLRDAPKTRA